eukprot:TRINITY_DN43140_c0_g1_i1.p1 TRINITY_DN43140_c0_g1~~TRINITY_DN43140_c0_g1_i1.p1  ORF type:complete len:527 (-),score=50.27 TRINITY_DN43140_c0_g1_i1:323-1903(-)
MAPFESLRRSLSSSNLTLTASNPKDASELVSRGLGQLRRSFSGSGLVGVKGADTEDLISAEESGSWHYLVVDSGGIRERDTASYSRDSKRGGAKTRHSEGTILEIDTRRKAGWTRWLRCKDGDGWLFDVSPKDQKVRMVEVEVVCGNWQYRAIEDNIPIMQAPCPSIVKKGCRKTGKNLFTGQSLMVTHRVRPVNGKGTFLKLDDDLGWVVDFAAGKQLLQRIESPKEKVVDVCKQATAPVATLAVESQTAGPSEHGEWDYVVLESKGISMRECPVYDSAKTGKRIEEGEIVSVVERRCGDGFNFLRLLTPQGWAIDGSPGGQSSLRMCEVTVERGEWAYLVMDGRVDIRSRCSLAPSTTLHVAFHKGVLLSVKMRVKVGESMFLKLKHREGWLFEAKRGRKVLEGPIDMTDAPEGSTATVTQENGVSLSKHPSNEPVSKTAMLVLHGSRVQVEKSCEVFGQLWYKVSQPGGTLAGWATSTSLNVDFTSSNDRSQKAASNFSADRVRAAFHAPSPLCEKGGGDFVP